MSLLLASASPRRADILRELGIEFDVMPADVDESVLANESPEAHVERLAREKAAAVRKRAPGRWVLAGDTVVVADGAILGKPRDSEEAAAMLLRLEGRTHRVASGLALLRPDGEAFAGASVTRVTFRPFDRSTAEAYVHTGEPMGKAGAYAIQGRGSALVTTIEGDYSGVVGLPVPLLMRLMHEAGRDYRFGAWPGAAPGPAG